VRVRHCWAAILGALLSAALAAGCTSSGPSATHPPAAGHGCAFRAAAAPGANLEITVPIAPALAAGARFRTAVIHVPRSYRPGRPAPVVLEFHGASPDATAAGYLRGSPLEKISDREGFLDVFLQGLRQPSGNVGWNAYGPVLYKVAELPFVEAVIARIERDFCVNRREIYASGISNGANMVNYLACRATAREIAAIAPVVGPMYGQDDGPCAPPRPVPILDVHSVNDPAVPYGGIPAGAGGFPLPSVPAWLRGWARLDGCHVKPAVEQVAPGQRLSRWSRCAAGAEILAYAVHAGHGWPETLGGVSAAEVVWRFFAAHPLPASAGAS